MDNERKAAGGGELAQRIRQRYGESPGVIPMAVTQNLINRMRGFGIDRLPLLADWQRRWAPAVSAFPGGAAGLTYAWPTEFFRPPFPPSEGIRAIGDNRMARIEPPASPRTPIVVARVQSPPERSAAASSGRESFPNTAVEKLQPGEPEYRVAQNTAQAVSSSGAPGTAIVQRQVDNPRQQAVPLHAPAVGTPLARTGGEPEPVRVQRHATDPTRQAVPANHPDSLTPVVVARGPSPPERPAATSSRRESFPNTAVGQLPPGEPVAYGVAHSVASQGEPGTAIVQRQVDNPRQQAVPLHAPAVGTPLARTDGEPEPARVQRHAASPTRQAVSANHPDSLTPSARTGGELGPAIVQRHSVSPTRQALPDAGADGVLPARQGDEWGPAILQHHLNSPLGQTVQRVRVSPDWAASSPAVAARQRSAQPVAEAHLTVPLPPARPALANDADRSEPIQPADVPSNGGLALAATPLPSPLFPNGRV